MKPRASMNLTSSSFLSRHRRRSVYGALCGSLSLLVAALPGRVHGESLLAYSRGDTIYTASARDGKNLKKICRGEEPCISSDGRFLAYTRYGALPPKDQRTGQQGAAPRSIIVRELAGGKETVLPVGDATQVYGAIWSADDTWIAFNLGDGKSEQIAVAHPDGSALRTLTDKLNSKNDEYSLMGWNRHDGGVLVRNMETLVQLNPETGDVAWRRPIKEVTGEEGASSCTCCTISADGKLFLATREVDKDEFNNLDGPSAYLVLADFPGGKPRRVTPVKFDVTTPWLESSGGSVLLRGFREKDVTVPRAGDNVKLKTRIYRYDIRTGALTPVTKDGDCPSASRP